MEPVTHVLTGACLARAGLNRRAAYATAVMAIAAEFPDIDTVSSLRGSVTGFAHHRGITHTFIGTPVEAAFLVGLAWMFHTWRSRETNSGSRRVGTRAPVRWLALYGMAVLALLSHVLLDFTNNYGIRPFYPFNPRWYAGSFVFILDPLMLVFLVGGLLLPSLLSLVRQEIGAAKERFPGTLTARVALVAVLCLWCVRAYAHQQALDLAALQTMRAPAGMQVAAVPPPELSEGTPTVPEETRPLLRLERSWASPDPLNPFRWYVVSDFGAAYQLATVDTEQATYSPYRLLNKPVAKTPCLQAAERSFLGRVYLDWSPMPWISASAASGEPGARNPACLVLFQDPRFMSSSSLLSRGKQAPLTGFVEVDSQGRVVEQGMDGRVQK